jgi:SAM-dependent methyltransferase
MGLGDLLAQNVLIRWLRGRGASPDLALSMTGVRLGERVAQIGLGDGALFVALAGKVGLTGRACGVDEGPVAVRRARRAAERAGVLVELEQAPVATLPLDAGAFDLVVVMAASSTATPEAAVLAEALRVLRPGGRCVAVVPAGRGGLFGAIAAARDAGPQTAPQQLVDRFQQCGFRASRLLAAREGLAFFEAMKAG